MSYYSFLMQEDLPAKITYAKLISGLNLLKRYKLESRRKVQQLLRDGDLANAYCGYSWDSDKHQCDRRYNALRKQMWKELRVQFSELSDSDFENQFGEMLD